MASRRWWGDGDAAGDRAGDRSVRYRFWAATLLLLLFLPMATPEVVLGAGLAAWESGVVGAVNGARWG